MKENFSFKSKLFRWNTEKGSWYFVEVPKLISEDINYLFSDKKSKWGSVPVEAKIGFSAWNTSLFPDKKSKSFILPIKKTIRQNENLKEGDFTKIIISF